MKPTTLTNHGNALSCAKESPKPAAIRPYGLPDELLAPPHLEGNRAVWRGNDILRADRKTFSFFGEKGWTKPTLYGNGSTFGGFHAIEYIPLRAVPEGVSAPPGGWEFWGQGPLNIPCEQDSEDIIRHANETVKWVQGPYNGRGWSPKAPYALRIGSEIHARNFHPEMFEDKPKPFTIQPGRRYVRRDGQISGPLVASDGSYYCKERFPLIDPSTGSAYTTSGAYFDEEYAPPRDSPEDLIAPHAEAPAPVFHRYFHGMGNHSQYDWKLPAHGQGFRRHSGGAWELAAMWLKDVLDADAEALPGYTEFFPEAAPGDGWRLGDGYEVVFGNGNICPAVIDSLNHWAKGSPIGCTVQMNEVAVHYGFREDGTHANVTDAILRRRSAAPEKGEADPFAPVPFPKDGECGCERCVKEREGRSATWMVLCSECGNKRCPKANDHRHACTHSNEVGQAGSSWEHVKPHSPTPAPDGAARECKANFIWPPKSPLEVAGYEFVNALTEDYRKEWWERLVDAATEVREAAGEASEMVRLFASMTALARLKYGNLDAEIYAEIRKAEDMIASLTQRPEGGEGVK